MTKDEAARDGRLADARRAALESVPIKPGGGAECPHCKVTVHTSAVWQTIAKDDQTGNSIVLEYFQCAACNRPVVALLEGTAYYASAPGQPQGMSRGSIRWTVYPRVSNRPLDQGVPDSLARDYREAAAILHLSPTASAALSRRCLQNTIREVAAIKKGSLQDEIAALVDGGLVSSGLASELDAIRSIGNFAAHPTKDLQTGLIVDVEPGEAEWTLDLLDRLFDELIVQPALSRERKSALNAKLATLGKPPLP